MWHPDEAGRRSEVDGLPATEADYDATETSVITEYVSAATERRQQDAERKRQMKRKLWPLDDNIGMPTDNGVNKETIT